MVDTEKPPIVPSRSRKRKSKYMHSRIYRDSYCNGTTKYFNSMTDGDSFEEFIEEDQAVEAEDVECIDFTCLNNVPVAQIEISSFDNNDSSGNTCIEWPINQTYDTINVLSNLEKARCSA